MSLPATIALCKFGVFSVHRVFAALFIVGFLPACSGSQFSLAPDKGRLLATGGVTQVEGSAGGGVSTWSLISGYGSEDSYGANAFYTRSKFNDFDLESTGAAIGVGNRFEVSYARQSFDTGEAGARLGLREGYTFEQDIVGAKLRLIGNAVYDQDTWVPQVSVGAQYKKIDRDDVAVVNFIGGARDEDVDFYASATKLFLDKNLLLSGTLRATRANQFGLLGFGGDLNDNRSLQFEGSAAYMINRKLVVGGDYRTKPDNLGFAEENDTAAAYIAYFPNKHISITLAGVDLGNVALQGRQRGAYISTQIGF